MVPFFVMVLLFCHLGFLEPQDYGTGFVFLWSFSVLVEFFCTFVCFLDVSRFIRISSQYNF